MLLRTAGSRTRVKVTAAYGARIFALYAAAPGQDTVNRDRWTSGEQFSPPRPTRHQWLPHALSRRWPKESVT